MRFSNEIAFELQGEEFRKEHRSDSWYVVGKGMLTPVDSKKEANELIREYSDEVNEPHTVDK